MNHYSKSKIQPIDIMRLNFTDEEYLGFLKGNILKYLLRDKGQDASDAFKIRVYAKWLEDYYIMKEKKDESNETIQSGNSEQAS